MPKKRRPSPDSPNKKFWKKLRWPLLIVVACLCCWAGIVRSVNGYDEYSFAQAKDLGAKPVAIIFGAGLIDGKPSLILKLRLDGGIELYKLGKVKKLLMSGDNRFHGYNEPEAMRQYAVEH